MSARASGARGSAPLPSAHAPAITQQIRPADEFDAVLAISVPPANAGSVRAPPESSRWRELDARTAARFVRAEIPWAHVDLSAATRSGGLAHIGTDITGFGVRFALELLLRQKTVAALEKRP